MKNIKLTLEYDGTNFHGWQIQEGLRTVEGELKKALDLATQEDIKIISAGRTDRRVHGKGQVANFRTSIDIPGENYKRLMDFLLPDDISISRSEEVPMNFHSRFDAKKREYRYLVYRRELPNALYRNFTYHFPYKLDLPIMRETARYLVGTHDFRSFMKSTREDHMINTVRTIDRIDIQEKGQILEFRILGNSFLYNMVRIIVGTLLYVGTGKLKKEEVLMALRSGNRAGAGITVGAQGLFLEKVYY